MMAREARKISPASSASSSAYSALKSFLEGHAGECRQQFTRCLPVGHQAFGAGGEEAGAACFVHGPAAREAPDGHARRARGSDAVGAVLDHKTVRGRDGKRFGGMKKQIRG